MDARIHLTLAGRGLALERLHRRSRCPRLRGRECRPCTLLDDAPSLVTLEMPTLHFRAQSVCVSCFGRADNSPRVCVIVAQKRSTQAQLTRP